MDLILWRHAEAEEGAPDSRRKLTAKGEKQAEKIAAWLRGRLPDDARVLVSPTTRTQQTASALQRPFETVDLVATGASYRSILDAAQWLQGEGTVLIVGHQPALGETAAWLLSGAADGWTVKKGALWWFASRGRGVGERQAILRAVISPDLV
jgi:phosphohistidine phosphatase